MSEVTIRKFTLDDAATLARLANNKKIWLNVRDRMPFPYTEKDGLNFIKFSHEMEPVSVFGICADNELVGAIGLHPMSDVYRLNAEMGYWLGEEYWNKGYTSAAIPLICEFGFKDLNLNKICASVYDHNEASKHLLEKFGFEKEGVFKNHVIKDGRLLDEHYYALPRETYEKL